MALPTSGPLSLSDIQTEFGGTNPISLSEYYAGGGLVPAGTSGTNGPVPSSGTISISNFYGTTNVVISISNQNIADGTGGARSATAGYRLTSGGQVEQLVNVTFTNLEQWCTPTSEASNYEARVTVNVGSLSSGTTGTWVALSTTQTWTRTANIGDSQLCEFLVEIRRTGTATVLDSATIELLADAQL
jgi:hypothetical protein